MTATATRQAAVVNFASAKYSVELREIPRPEIGPEDVLLEVAAVGVCGSDLHQWTSEHSWPVNYPVVLGHEFSGTVVQFGARVSGWKEGDRGVSETAAVIDPDSPYSRQGLYNLDPSRKGFGYGVDGAMTRFVRVPAHCLHHLPDGLSFEKAGLTEPCCVAFNAVVLNAAIKPGDRVVVLGPGPIGILCGAMARLQGAQVAVVGLERDRIRLAVAEQFGCEAVVDGLDEWVRAGDGLGVDGVIDAAGISATLKTALDIVRPAGWISKVGWGRAAVQSLARSSGAEKHYPARQLQPQLADLGTRDPLAGHRTARRRQDHRRRLVAGELAHRVRGNAQRADRQSRAQAGPVIPLPAGERAG